MSDPSNVKSPSIFSPSGFRDVVSGRRRGLAAATLRAILAAAEVPYTWVVRHRNRQFDCGTWTIQRVDVPVISVGNITLGGTGKTPMVEWIVRYLQMQGKRAGIVSRGYGARGGINDEAQELAWKLPGVPHLQNPDRVAAARQAVSEFGCQALVLDDGFQHRRIARDLDVVLLDALEPLGFEHVFPRGTLREPVEGLARADVIALSRANVLSAEQRALIHDRVTKLSLKATWLEVLHAPMVLVAARQEPGFESAGSEVSQPLESLKGRPVLAFCGLGNPAGFRHTLEACGYQVVEFFEFPDHHTYGPADREALAAAAQRLGVEAVVCTQKDLVKLGGNRLGDRPLWAIRVGIEFMAGRREFENVILASVAERR
jgi:tetraacyldisaccharide 4'-kinase